jgi:hypothetical protein
MDRLKDGAFACDISGQDAPKSIVGRALSAVGRQAIAADEGDTADLNALGTQRLVQLQIYNYMLP